jgi:hypothetical protein
LVLALGRRRAAEASHAAGDPAACEATQTGRVDVNFVKQRHVDYASVDLANADDALVELVIELDGE